MKTIILSMVLVLSSVALAAENHKLTLFQTSYMAGTELAAGDYTLVLDGARVMLKKGSRTMAESDARIEANDTPYSSTTIRYDTTDGGKYRITEIHIGRTTTRIVLT